MGSSAKTVFARVVRVTLERHALQRALDVLRLARARIQELEAVVRAQNSEHVYEAISEVLGEDRRDAAVVDLNDSLVTANEGVISVTDDMVSGGANA
jgi:hypothetical protein